MKTVRLITFATLCLSAAGTAVAGGRKPPPAPEFSSILAHGADPRTKVQVAVEPYDTREKASFFRNDYNAHSVLPLRVFIRNDNDVPLDLKEVRIQFVDADGTRHAAATPDELNGRLFRFKDLRERRIPGTPIPYRPTPVDKKVLDDDRDFSLTQTLVAPHSTAEGFLFYDVHDVDAPALAHAQLYVRQAHLQDAAHTEVFGIEVDFDPYIRAEQAAQRAARQAQQKADGKADDAKPAESK